MSEQLAFEVAEASGYIASLTPWCHTPTLPVAAAGVALLVPGPDVPCCRSHLRSQLPLCFTRAARAASDAPWCWSVHVCARFRSGIQWRSMRVLRRRRGATNCDQLISYENTTEAVHCWRHIVRPWRGTRRRRIFGPECHVRRAQVTASA